VGPRGPMHLSRRSMDALLALAGSPSVTVSRNDLLARLWPDGGHHDDALTKCISELRQALGDRGKVHTTIETVTRQGYRLLVAPEPLSQADRSTLERAASLIGQRRPPAWEFLFGGDRRQRALRVGGAYAAAAWAVMQVADVTFERLGLSERGVTFVIVLAMLGFPIVVALAWFYRPEHTVVRPRATPAALVTSALVLVVGLSAAAWFLVDRLRSAPGTIPVAERSIAVLPFTNMSGDPANDYLGDGLAEELSTQLARLPDLQVASRTSAFTFRGGDADIATIAAALGVRHILEGSVRRQGEKVRVTAQLIDASNGFHLWANTFDRPVDDIFAIEDSISSSVVEALKIVLSPETREQLLARPTGSPGAYDLYLRGRGQLRLPSSKEAIDEAERLFREALRADPAYAQAYAGLCEAGVSRYVLEKSADAVVGAEGACAQAVRLDADQPDVHRALGKLYIATGQYVSAETHYREAYDADPQDPHALIGIADALAGQGRDGEAEASYKAAIRLKPRYWRGYDAYGAYLFKAGRAEGAAEQYRVVTELAPDVAGAWNNLGAARFVLGEFSAAARSFRRSADLEPTSEGFSNTGTMHYYAGEIADAVGMFEEAVRLAPDDHVMWGNLADAYRAQGGQADVETAAYENAARLARSALRIDPDDSLTRAMLAYYLVRLGDPGGARAEITSSDPSMSANPYAHYYAALVESGLGERDRALHHLAQAVDLGFPVDVIRSGPEWVSLRDEPGFPGAARYEQLRRTGVHAKGEDRD
ncbi:MAG TPA: tetratricopeptide repeat protein, partial [Steroidobacteraceae bacterium]|nr:tetratricopeptide repeat protein [Steroidobacteraceae bacterium]